MRVFGGNGGSTLVALVFAAAFGASATSAWAESYPIFQPTRLSAHLLGTPSSVANAPYLTAVPDRPRLSAGGTPRLGGIASRGRPIKVRYGGALQCVPFARAVSGIEIRGNAANWWEAAQGVYQRGSRPEYGSVLNFRPTRWMHLGHVAVVTAVLDSRQIEIEHANWAGPSAPRGGITRNISVIDVSPGNDWSAVRVSLGHSGSYGSVYPTYGFIYDRPERGASPEPRTIQAAAPGSRFGHAGFRLPNAIAASYDEVAQERRVGTLDMFDASHSFDMPDRGIR